MLRFQSTFPRGERLWHIRDYRHIMLFQSTFPRGERRLLPERRDAMLGNFNPRSLVGNDVSVQRNLYRGFNFNPRSLVGNDQSPRSCRRCPRYFNPRSLVGNDLIHRLHAGYDLISIHVPSWGTTGCLPRIRRTSDYFNPRSLVGNDSIALQAYVFWLISIHVPSWGTTKQPAQSADSK